MKQRQLILYKEQVAEKGLQLRVGPKLILGSVVGLEECLYFFEGGVEGGGDRTEQSSVLSGLVNALENA